MFRGDLAYAPPIQEEIARLFERLADVEFEGPGEIYALARETQKNVARRIALATVAGPMVAAQRNLTLKVAQARRDIALTGSINAPREATRILEARDDLIALAGERVTIAGTSPPEYLVDSTLAALGPFMQGGDPAHRSALASVAQGFAQLAASTFAAAPAIVAQAHRSLGECGFDGNEIGCLLFSAASGAVPAFEEEFERLRESFNGGRAEFLREAERHLDEPLPVPH
ncbi:hypothetical protein GCM10010313_54900 [Streptomyces violarus]|nr:hypothetical protein GCM10010313_54900 [Streptomyces violarus]